MEKMSHSLYTLEIFLILFSIGGILGFIGHIFLAIPLAFLFLFWFFVAALFMLLQFPRTFLFFLIIVRMSLDYTSEYISIPVTQSVSITLSQITGVAVFALMTIFFFFRRATLANPPLKTPMIILFLWGCATFVYSVAPQETLKEIIRIADVFLLYVLSFSVFNTKDSFKRLLQVILLSAILPLSFALSQYVLGIGLSDAFVSIPRIFGTFAHPSVLGLYLLIIFTIGWLYGLLYAKSSTNRTGIMFLMLVVTAVIGMTYARIIWIDCMILALLLSYVTWGKRMLPIAIIGILFFLSLPTVQERFADVTQKSVDSSILWRIQLWNDMIDYTFLSSAQYFGQGLNTAQTVIGNYRGQTYGDVEPHNDALKFFLEGGYIGLALFVVYTVWVAWYLFRKYQNAPNVPAKTVAFFLLVLWALITLASMSDNVFKNTPVQWIFWILLGAASRAYFIPSLKTHSHA